MSCFKKREPYNDIERYYEIRRLKEENEKLLKQYSITKENEHKIMINGKTFIQQVEDLIKSQVVYGDSGILKFDYESNLKRIEMLIKLLKLQNS